LYYILDRHSRVPYSLFAQSLNAFQESQFRGKNKQDRQRMYIATLRNVRARVVVVEKL